MKKILSILLPLLILPLCSPALADAKILTTPAGHEILFLPLPDADQVAIQTAWPTTWPRTPGKNPAVPYVAAQLLAAGGAGDLSPAEVVERSRDLQLASGLVPTIDFVRGSLLIQSDSLDETLTFVNTVITQPRFDGVWLERIKTGLHGRQEQMNGSAEALAWNAARTALFGDQPVRDSLSLTDTGLIQAVTEEEVRAWHRETYVTGGVEIVITGPLGADQASAAVDRMLEGVPVAVVPGNSAPAPVTADFSPGKILWHQPQSPTAYMLTLGRLPPSREGGEFEDTLSVVLLGQGEGSALFRAIRTELRASYAFAANILPLTRDIRVLFMGGEVEADRIEQVHETILDTYSGFIENGPQTEIGGLKTAVINNLRTGLSDPAAAAIMALGSALDGFDPARLDRLIREEVEPITAETLTARMQSVFPAAGSLLTVVVAPDPDLLPGACVVRSLADVSRCR